MTVAGFSSGMTQSVKSMVPGALLNIRKNHFVRDFTVASLAGADVILGVSWFRQYKPQINWDSDQLFCASSRGGTIDLLQDDSQVPCISTVHVVASPTDPVVQGSSFSTPSTSIVASTMHVHKDECFDSHDVLFVAETQSDA